MFSTRDNPVKEKKYSTAMFGSALRRREGDTVTDNNALFIAHRMREREEIRKKGKLEQSPLKITRTSRP